MIFKGGREGISVCIKVIKTISYCKKKVKITLTYVDLYVKKKSILEKYAKNTRRMHLMLPKK